MTEASSAQGSLATLRQRLLVQALNIVAVAAPLLGGLVIEQASRRGDLGARTLLPTAFTLVFPLLRLGLARLGFRVAAGAFLGLLLATAFLVQLNGGLSTSAAALMLLVLLLSGVIFGRRGVLFGLLAALLVFVSAGLLVVGHYGPPIAPGLWDPNRALTWVRAGVALVAFGGAGALSVANVVERLDAEAGELRAALERETRERALREGAERALAQSQRMEAVARLAAGVAHDFNNALTVIRASADFVLSGSELDSDAQDCLRDIVKATQRASGLTSQLLTLSRRDVSTPKVVELCAYFERFMPSLRRLLPSDIEISLGGGGELAIRVDETQLERALLNLAVNARDAMPRGGRLEIGWQTRALRDSPWLAGPGLYAAVSIADTGAGMDEATRERMFEPFFTTKGVGAGTGLGLAMVQAFVAGARGGVEVDSKLGEGTKVTLLLPAHSGPARVSDAAPAASISAEDLRGRSVLVVEDDVAVRAGIERAFRGAGVQVRSAADGDQALAILADPSYACDLLCIDGVIPGASSAQVIERASGRSPPPSILVCSGYVEEDLVRRGVEAFKYALLRKPFAPADLISRASELLAQTKRQAE